MRSIFDNRHVKLLQLAGTVTLFSVPLLFTSMVTISVSRSTPGQAIVSRGPLLAVSATPLYAEEPAAPATDPVTGLSAQEAVALGPDAFVKQYTTKANDNSPASVQKALEVFYQFQREFNRQATLPLPKKTQHVIGDLRESLRCTLAAYIASEEALDEGGTIYGDIRARAAVDREVTLAQILATLQTPEKDPKGRRVAEKGFATLEATIRNLPAPAPTTTKAWVTRYRKAHSDLLACVPKLRRSFHQLPDKAAEIMVEFLRHQITP